jgi:hypothetical protein
MIRAEKNRKAAAARKAAYDAQIQEIMSGPYHLQHQQMAASAAYIAARGDIAQIRQADAVATERRGEAITRRLFGDLGKVTGEAALSLRDAWSAAREIKTPEQAAELLNQAQITGDVVLSKAILSRCLAGGDEPADAVTRGAFGAPDRWKILVGQYSEAYPESAPLISELTALTADEPGFLDQVSDHEAHDIPVPPVLQEPGVKSRISDLAAAFANHGEPPKTISRPGGGMYLPQDDPRVSER